MGIFLASGTPPAMACTCLSTPPPCQAYSEAGVVFLGTLTEVLAERSDGWVQEARVRVDKTYKGVTETSVVLFDNGMCDGPTLKLGEQYLWYTHGGKTNVFPSRGCSRSRHVRHAGEDLNFLERLSNAAPTGTVFGQVLVRSDDYYGNDKPASGAAVTLSGPSGAFHANTDPEGQYFFGNLEPGKYSIRAELAGYRPLQGIDDWLRGPVSARGCQVANVIMRRTWAGRVTGRLIRANGAPAGAKIPVNLFRVEGKEGKQRGLLIGHARTDETGRYGFDAVAPGRYRIVMNLYSFPTSRSPYPTIYWPAGRKEWEGLVVEVTDNPVETQYDFQLPPEPASETVEGLVLADGKPVAGVTVQIRAGEQSIGSGDENRPKTDENGRFRFQAFEGFPYRVNAVGTDSAGRSMHSADSWISVPTNGRSLFLVLDRPGRFDNDPAERLRTSQVPK